MPSAPKAAPALLVCLADLRDLQGRYAEAEAAYREAAARLDPRDGSLPFALGSALLRQGRPEEAEAEYREAVSLQPSRLRFRTSGPFE